MPTPGPIHTSRPSCSRRGWWLLPGLLAVALAGWWYSEWHAPQSPTQTLLQQAADALARGHLSATDGSGARELYAAVQAINPDLPEARRGQVQVGLAALAQARQALAREDLPTARHNLALARQLQVPRAEWEAVATALHQQERDHADIDTLLERAETARSQGWLVTAPPEWPEEASALELYQRILTLQPGHAAALRGREEALGTLLDEARAALRSGDLDTAAAAIAIARQHDPGHIDLPDTLARYTEENAARQQPATARAASARTVPHPATPTPSLQAARACFEAQLAANNLGRARECLDTARAQGEDTATLNTRQRQLAQRWIAIGEERLGRSDLPAAAAALAAAREADPAAPGLQALTQRLETAQR